MLAKVYAEIVESVDAAPARALRRRCQPAAGHPLRPDPAGRQVASYTVYRWECAIRASVVMGLSAPAASAS